MKSKTLTKKEKSLFDISSKGFFNGDEDYDVTKVRIGGEAFRVFFAKKSHAPQFSPIGSF